MGLLPSALRPFEATMQRAFQSGFPPTDLQYVPEDYVRENEDSRVAIASGLEIGSPQKSLAADTAFRIPPHGVTNINLVPAEPASSRLALRQIAGVVAASRLERPPVPRVPFGIAQVDELTGGLPRGGLTEICGGASSGRTTLMISAMAEATARGELCVLVDAGDCFDPQSAATAGVDLGRLLWVRCTAGANGIVSVHTELTAPDVTALCSTLRQKQAVGSVMPHAKVWYGRSPARSERDNPGAQTPHQTASRKSAVAALANNKSARGGQGATESSLRTSDRRHWARCVDQALRATDLLLQGGGFGLIVVDLGDVPCEIARRVPLASWFRFRRAVENTPAVLLSIVRQSCAKTCASLVLEMQGTRRNGRNSEPQQDLQYGGKQDGLQSTVAIPAHARIFTGLDVTIEVARCAELQQDMKKPPRPARATFESHTEWTGQDDWRSA